MSDKSDPSDVSNHPAARPLQPSFIRCWAFDVRCSTFQESQPSADVSPSPWGERRGAGESSRPRRPIGSWIAPLRFLTRIETTGRTALAVLECGGKSARHRFRTSLDFQMAIDASKWSDFRSMFGVRHVRGSVFPVGLRFNAIAAPKPGEGGSTLQPFNEPENSHH